MEVSGHALLPPTSLGGRTAKERLQGEIAHNAIVTVRTSKTIHQIGSPDIARVVSTALETMCFVSYFSAYRPS
ncbi:hypothetical protein TNCV_4108821 [Trichonephila clavipes]|nr:hypothetical protein TNCV_4108821 [Trichonephila clavipes]